MFTPPDAIIPLLLPFSTLFQQRTWLKAQILLVGAILSRTIHRRSVSWDSATTASPSTITFSTAPSSSPLNPCGIGQPQHPQVRLLYEAFEPSVARRLEFHYTPIHGSWLNMAVQCLQQTVFDRRIGDEETLKREISNGSATKPALL